MRAALVIACGFAACRAQFSNSVEFSLFQWPGLRAISESANTCQWSQSTALLEVGTDVSIFLDSFDAAQSQVLARISTYATQPWFDLKPAMEFALAAAELYQLPGLSTALKAQLATRVRLIADAVLAVRNDAQVQAQCKSNCAFAHTSLYIDA